MWSCDAFVNVKREPGWRSLVFPHFLHFTSCLWQTVTLRNSRFTDCYQILHTSSLYSLLFCTLLPGFIFHYLQELQQLIDSLISRENNSAIDYFDKQIIVSVSLWFQLQKCENVLLFLVLTLQVTGYLCALDCRTDKTTYLEMSPLNCNSRFHCLLFVWCFVDN